MYRVIFHLICFVCLVNLVFGFNVRQYKKVVRKMSEDVYFQRDFTDNVINLLEKEPNYYDYTPLHDGNLTFDCTVSQRFLPATSVHRLRPSDVKIVAAMGDSLTAALGSIAKNVQGLGIEYRGRSWSIGGDLDLNQLVTMPNILKKFSPKLTGYSTGSNVIFTPNKNAALNEAISGRKANDIPSQVERLISDLKMLKNVDYKQDWKVITLFIGGNDLCFSCYNKDKFSPESYIENIKIGLDMLYEEVPRAFVNLVTILNITQVKRFNSGLTCSVLHRLECSCAAYPVGDQAEQVKNYMEQYQNFTEMLVQSGRYDGKDDFTVVVQPFFTGFTAPNLPDGSPDLSFLAPDCFHFSTKGHAAAAVGLWNNMLQPVGKKSNTWTPQDQILCPNKDSPYFYTIKNSN